MNTLVHLQDENHFYEKLRALVQEEIGNLIKNISKVEDQEKLLTRNEVMAYFGISATTLYYRQKNGTIKYHKIGRKILFKASEIGLTLRSEN